MDTIPGKEAEGEIVLKGALTIQRVSEIKEELTAALEQVDKLMIDLSEATELDLTCLQLLCSGHRAAIRINKSLSMVGSAANISSLIGKAGFARPVRCPSTCAQSCIWGEK